MKPYEVTMRSVIGTRADQQDFSQIKDEDDELLIAVCDGMGGLEGGSIASKITIEQLFSLYEKKENAEDIRDFYLNTVDILDEQVFSLIDSQGDRLNAGTTIVCSHLKNNKLDWLSVGDSRLYIIRGKEIVRATRDHNYKLILDDMLLNGKIKADEYAGLISKGEALISYIGIGGIEVMDISKDSLALQAGDYILATSDGLYKILTDEEIMNIITANSTLDEKADNLLSFASEHANGVQDNTTFVLIKIN